MALAASACAPPRDPAPVCEPGDPERERWGTDCPCCHAEFGVAGSVDLSAAPVARVRVLDATGRRAEMVPNPYGNFFRHVQLQAPLTVEIQGQDGSWLVMQDPAPHGSCNRCHRPEGEAPRVSGPPAIGR